MSPLPSLEEIFPPFALRVTCGDVELRVLRDADLPELVELVRGGVRAPGQPAPFISDWADRPFALGDPDASPGSSLRWWWQQRAMVDADDWRLAFVVRKGGELVGMQDVSARRFPHLRSIATGSWLGRSHQGQGTGTLMRQMVVVLAFDELGAQECTSGYVTGNGASAAVSRRVGYRDNGTRRVVQQTPEGPVGAVEHVVAVTPESFVRPAEPVAVEGAAPLRRFLQIPG